MKGITYLRYIYLAIFLSLFSFHFSFAQTSTFLILDGSGSMWGQVDGVTKIEIARSVVGNLVDDMDPNQEIGLVVYGHRKKGDCTDIETILEPGTNNRSEIKDALAKLNPMGKTPLAQSAIQVIEKLKSNEEKATIILVSDGAESCGGDLCAVIKAAKEAGVDFVLHIVGFDIGESDKAALQCAANEGGGLYLDAENGEQLGAALDEVSELTVEKITNTLSVKVMKDGELNDATIRVYTTAAKREFSAKRLYDDPKSNPGLMNVTPGTYDIEAYLLGANLETGSLWIKDYLIEGDTLQKIEFDFTTGSISIKTTANDDKLWDSVVHINRSEDQKNIAGGRTYKSDNSNPMVKVLTPGTYDVVVKAMKLSGKDIEYKFQDVVVKSGEETALEHNFEYGEISVHSQNNDDNWDSVVSVLENVGSKQKSITGGRTYTSETSNPKIYLVTPGQYQVKYKAMHILGKENVHMSEMHDVVVGQTTEVAHQFRTGVLQFNSTLNGEAHSVDLYFNQNGEKVFSKRIKSGKEIYVTEGEYQLMIRPVGKPALEQTLNVHVIAGQRIEKTLTF